MYKLIYAVLHGIFPCSRINFDIVRIKGFLGAGKYQKGLVKRLISLQILEQLD